MLLNKTEIAILEEFTKDKDKRIYGREIAKSKKMNQKTISNTLNKLEEEGIIKYKKEGKNKYYFLNTTNENIREIIHIIENIKKIKFMGDNPKINLLIRELEERTDGILIVFGSYASNTKNKNSDLDLLVIGKIKDLSDLEETFGLDINVINMTKDKFDKNQPIIKEIINNHIILKGLEEFTKMIW